MFQIRDDDVGLKPCGGFEERAAVGDRAHDIAVDGKQPFERCLRACVPLEETVERTDQASGTVPVTVT
jgi:hypothetical protein